VIRRLILLLAAGCVAGTVRAAPAQAFNPIKPVCGAAGFVSGVLGKACKVVQDTGRLAKASKQLGHGHIGNAVKTFFGGGGSGAASAASAVASKASTLIGLAAIGAWVLGGAKFALDETAKVLSQTTTPQLRSTWFSSTYWRMAAIAAVLTLPFLFAAAIQALVRSDIGLLTRAAFGYLPLAMLAVGIAAPLTMLLLVCSDQLSAIVSAAAGHASERFLGRAGAVAGGLAVFAGSPFLAFLVGLFTAAVALALWIELLVREVAVYVIVLMLPLAFAALVWPARRIWAIRAVELLAALVLSKFAIVAVLSLGGAALNSSFGRLSIAGAIAGGTLVAMASFAPWALLRLLPLAEVASGAAGTLRADGLSGHGRHIARAERVENLVSAIRVQAQEALSVDGASVAASANDQTNGAGAMRDGADRVEQGKSAEATEVSALAEDPLANAVEFATAVNPGAAPAAAPGAADEQRLPGMEPRWQAKDMSWQPLKLGLEHWPPPDPWDGEGASGGQGERDEPPERTQEPDPRPAGQPPVDGRL
jgi:hypothetical protein